MRWLDAVTRLLDVLLWPTVVVIALLVFRAHLGRAIDRVRKVSSGERSIELSVEDALELPARRRSTSRDPTEVAELSRNEREDQELIALAKSRPDKAVWESYVRVLQPLRSITGEIGGHEGELNRALFSLSSEGRLDSQISISGAALERVARSVYDRESTLEPTTAMGLVRTANELHALLDEMRPGSHLD